MTAPAGGKLYSPALLALATELAEYPLNNHHALRGEASSRTCGSTIAIGIDSDGSGRISALGMQVSACAVGQASAAIFARHAVGQGLGEIEETTDAVERWLSGEGELPQWPDFSVLEPARDYTGRHGALLLPWKAAREALCKQGTSG